MTEEKDVKEANLPILKHKILLTEDAGHIILDITDETGGLGLKLMILPHVAADLGYRMMERARYYAAKAADDPARTRQEEFNTGAQYVSKV